MKQCTKCKKRKDESEFYRKRRNKDGLAVWCKECADEATNECRRRRSAVRKQRRYEESHRIVNGVKEKRCRRCKKWKAESEFYKSRKSKDGLGVYCKKCTIEAKDKSYEQRLAARN